MNKLANFFKNRIAEIIGAILGLAIAIYGINADTSVVKDFKTTQVYSALNRCVGAGGTLEIRSFKEEKTKATVIQVDFTTQENKKGIFQYFWKDKNNFDIAYIEIDKEKINPIGFLMFSSIMQFGLCNGRG